VVVLSNGTVESEGFDLPADMSELRVAAASAHLSSHLAGRTLESPLLVPGTGDREVDAVCAGALTALGRVRTEQPVFVGGAASMAQAFDAVDVVRSVLHTLEQQYVIVSLVRDVINRGLSIAIGAEHGIEPLVACSVVVKPVIVDGEQVGTLGVLGPTRMDYPQALATVEVVSDRLGRHLGDGGANG
jgi:heat-inducible transcriptional repressor